MIRFLFNIFFALMLDIVFVCGAILYWCGDTIGVIGTFIVFCYILYWAVIFDTPDEKI